MGDKLAISVKAVLLDLDGTLINSDQALPIIWRNVLRDRQMSCDPESIRRETKGIPAIKAAKRLFPDFPSKWRQTIATEIEEAEAIFPFQLMPGVEPFLHWALEKRLRTAIVTTSPRRKTNQVIKSFGWDNLVSFCVTADDVDDVKPDPAPYLLALKRLSGIDSEEVIAIEDSLVGIQSAKSANLICVHIGQDSVAGQADISFVDFDVFSKYLQNNVLRTVNDIATR